MHPELPFVVVFISCCDFEWILQPTVFFVVTRLLPPLITAARLLWAFTVAPSLLHEFAFSFFPFFLPFFFEGWGLVACAFFPAVNEYHPVQRLSKPMQ